MMVGGPGDGRIMAYGSHLMPWSEDGARVGSYIWDDDHWVYEKETRTPLEELDAKELP